MIDIINLYIMFEELLCRILNEIDFLKLDFVKLVFFLSEYIK